MFKKVFRLSAITVFASLLLGGGVAYAAHQFTDVPNSSPWHPTVDFIADRGITGGCGGGNYCPNDSVTRGQMSAFLEREARVLTPIIARTGSQTATNTASNCITGPYETPNYEQTAVIQVTQSIFEDGTVTGWWVSPRFSTNGGPWGGIVGQHTVSYASASITGHNSNTGALALSPNTSYRFSSNIVAASPTSGQCEVFVTIYHRMPGQVIDGNSALAATGVGTGE